MEIQIHGKPQLMLEAATLLVKIANKDTSFEELRAGIRGKFKSEQELLSKIDFVERLLSETEKALKGKEKEIEFYFKYVDKMQLCLADVLLCGNLGVVSLEDSMSGMKKRLQAMESKERDACFVRIFGMDDEAAGRITHSKEGADETTRTRNVLRFIMDMDLKPEDMNGILQMYLDDGRNLDKVCGLLELPLAVLKENEREVMDAAREFSLFFKEYSKGRDMIGELAKAGVQINEVKDICHVFPWITVLHSMGITWVDYDRPMLLRVGTLFNEEFEPFDFSLHKREFSRIMISQTLKILSDNSKFDILLYLKDKQAYGAEIAKEMNLTTATISHHMNNMVGQGLVKMDKEESRVYYSMNRENIADILDACKRMLID